MLLTAQTSRCQARVHTCGLNSEIFSRAAAARLSSSRGDTRNSILASACMEHGQQCHSQAPELLNAAFLLAVERRARAM